MKKIAIFLSIGALALGGSLSIPSRMLAQSVDTTPPVITLVGDATVQYLQGEVYEELGAAAEDAIDVSSSWNLEITGDLIDTSFTGEYYIAGFFNEGQETSWSWVKVGGQEGGFPQGADYYLVPNAFNNNLPFDFGRLEINGETEYWFEYLVDGVHIKGIIFKKNIGGKLLGTFDATFTREASGWTNTTLSLHSGIVDTSVPGTYYVRYNAKDRAGNAAQEVVRKVIVIDAGLTREQAYAQLRENDPNLLLPTSIDDPVETWVHAEQELVSTPDEGMISRLAGRILLQVEEHGEAWYLDPSSRSKYYLRDGRTAYEALRKFGLGITNADLSKIPIGVEDRFADADTDGDGLADKLEEALGTGLDNPDSDRDGATDGAEVLTNRTNPLGAGGMQQSGALSDRLKGKILLQVESKGEAWYVSPVDGLRYYMKDGDAAYQIMRFLSLGITNTDLRKIPVDSIE
ncbi:MAG: immunoglobulin-like domain-containing protein [Patescibacteria group bacterium]